MRSEFCCGRIQRSSYSDAAGTIQVFIALVAVAGAFLRAVNIYIYIYIFVVTAVVLGLDSNTYSRYIVVVRFLQLIFMYDTFHTFAHITFAHIYHAARTSLPERSRGGTRADDELDGHCGQPWRSLRLSIGISARRGGGIPLHRFGHWV